MISNAPINQANLMPASGRGNSLELALEVSELRYRRLFETAQDGILILDADSGKILWEIVLGGIVSTSTITYTVNGRQYVAVMTGDAQSGTAGLLNVVKTFKPVRGHNAIYVFALPEPR